MLRSQLRSTIILFLMIVGLGWIMLFNTSSAQEPPVFDSPIATPTLAEQLPPSEPPPTVTPLPPPSKEAQIALDYVSGSHQIPIEELYIGQVTISQYPLNSTYSGMANGIT